MYDMHYNYDVVYNVMSNAFLTHSYILKCM